MLTDEFVTVAFLNLQIQYPLHKAIGKNLLPVVRYLISNPNLIPDYTPKLNVLNMKDQYNSTPLHCAALNGHLSIVIFLIKKGAETNATDATGATPLHCAAEKNKLTTTKEKRLEIVKYLIAAGANIKAIDIRGQTALDIATEYHYHLIVKALQKANAERCSCCSLQ